MNDLRRRNHYDVTDRVFVADPRAVRPVVAEVVQALDPHADIAPLDRAFELFSRLYTGELEDYVGCETWYHDAQHSLDSTLTMARLLDGHERSANTHERLGSRRCVLGLIVALFHDAGYIRRASDAAHHGAEFTTWHVRRSADFLANVLPELGFAEETAMARQMVHFTGYELALDDILVEDPLDRRLGFILGSADLLAQMSDRCYLEKCRDCLYPEFAICGLAGPGGGDGHPEPMFTSPEDLMRGTPDFVRQMWHDRLDGYFEGVYRFEAVHFNGTPRYVQAIDSHLPRLRYALEHEGIHRGLRRRAECINAGPLRELLGLDPALGPASANGRPPRAARHP